MIVFDRIVIGTEIKTRDGKCGIITELDGINHCFIVRLNNGSLRSCYQSEIARVDEQKFTVQEIALDMQKEFDKYKNSFEYFVENYYTKQS